MQLTVNSPEIRKRKAENLLFDSRRKYPGLHLNNPPLPANIEGFRKSELDTLAQPRNSRPTLEQQKTQSCSCCSSNYETSLKRRAAVKHFANFMVLGLVDACRKRERQHYKGFMSGDVSEAHFFAEKSMQGSYWNTYHCSAMVKLVDGVPTLQRCKNRWCPICSRVRTSELIAKYYDDIKSWQSKKFVTLTIPNVQAEALEESIRTMISEFAKIKDLYRKVNGKKAKFKGFRKLEVTYNEGRKDYHPHFHLVVSNFTQAKFLVDEWLKRFPEASNASQDIRDCNEGSVKELMKYTTKFTSTDEETGKLKMMNPVALDRIYYTLRKGRFRTFQPFGFKAKKIEEAKVDEEMLSVVGEFENVETTQHESILKNKPDGLYYWVPPASNKHISGVEIYGGTYLHVEKGQTLFDQTEEGVKDIFQDLKIPYIESSSALQYETFASRYLAEKKNRYNSWKISIEESRKEMDEVKRRINIYERLKETQPEDIQKGRIKFVDFKELKDRNEKSNITGSGGSYQIDAIGASQIALRFPTVYRN